MHRKQRAKRCVLKFLVNSNACAIPKRHVRCAPSNNYANSRVKFAQLLWFGRFQLPKV
jgi:hypothetical protein